MIHELADKVVLVTGSGRGIGEAIACGFGDVGARVAVADIDGSSATRTAEKINAASGTAMAFTADVSEQEGVSKLFKELVREFGDLDVLVSNVGIQTTTATVDYTEELWDHKMAVNVKSAFLCAQAAAKLMIPKKRGKIINMTSTSAFVSSRRPKVAYDASKGAIRQMTVSMGAELARHGIHVNAIAPGTMLTEMTRPILTSEEQINSTLERIPIGRIGEPQDIVGPALFLASSSSDYIVGHTLVVDGGWLL